MKEGQEPRFAVGGRKDKKCGEAGSGYSEDGQFSQRSSREEQYNKYRDCRYEHGPQIRLDEYQRASQAANEQNGHHNLFPLVEFAAPLVIDVHREDQERHLREFGWLDHQWAQRDGPG